MITLLTAAAIGALGGLLGGMGGRALVTRLRFAEVWQALDSLSVRLSKREGAAGQRVMRANEGDEKQELLRALMGAKLQPAAPNLSPQDAAALLADRAAEHFAHRDGKPRNGVG